MKQCDFPKSDSRYFILHLNSAFTLGGHLKKTFLYLTPGVL